MKRIYPLCILVLASVMGCSEPVQSSAQADKKPNIIFILTDDQRWDAAGYTGNPIIKTPNIDALASQGTRFSNAFVTTSICAASRASIMTGTYERRHGFTFNEPPLAKKFIDNSYPKLLKDAGYTVGFVGKFGMQFEGDADKKLFDYYQRPGDFNEAGRYYQLNLKTHQHEHTTERIGSHSIEFIRQAAREGKPFNLSVSFHAPHADDHDPNQYVYPRDLESLYQDVEIPLSPLAKDEYFDAQPQWVKDSISKKRWAWRFDTPEKYQKMVKGYYRMITGLDREIGKIRAELDAQGVADNTIIMFMGDNGYFLSERQLAGKWLLYEDSIRVPFFVYDPRAPHAAGGKTMDQLVLNIDVAPTILKFAGLDAPAVMQGAALQSLIAGEQIDWRTQFLGEHLMRTDWIPTTEGVRTLDRKFIRYPQHPGYAELYDLKNDPLETRNLALDPAFSTEVEKMNALTDQLIAEAR
ncbi:sulfatase family protein [Simiduia agarivorans]|uniref:Sulfatase n=1 Tax=Simiduia agarivorans (strain DSM 21679 / JCM 13881 / BCRC 17597 / SA1) TaxID=1117647 RepID=K4KQR6_SIMAS|nr:sulfatase [Simiduia agarivorans]AFV00469.1 sulfatase [Simiduia agarivorans SA1 = DSM 21679]